MRVVLDIDDLLVKEASRLTGIGIGPLLLVKACAPS